MTRPSQDHPWRRQQSAKSTATSTELPIASAVIRERLDRSVLPGSFDGSPTDLDPDERLELETSHSRYHGEILY